jgi:DNA-binding transcriptional ArsR family regulator
MSVAASAWAWSVDLDDPSAKLVLLRLADAASSDDDKDGEVSCWPRVASLVSATGLSERTVRTKLGVLSERGLLTIERRTRANGRQASNRYVLNVESCTPTRVQPAHPEPATVAPLGTSYLEPEENRKTVERPRNVIWDVLAEHFGTPTTKSEVADFGKTCAEVRAALVALDPDPIFHDNESFARQEIGRRVEAMGEERYRSHRRLRSQWAELGRRAGTPADEVGVAIRGRADEEWGVCPCVHEIDGAMVANQMCADCGGTGKDGWAS